MPNHNKKGLPCQGIYETFSKLIARAKNLLGEGKYEEAVKMCDLTLTLDPFAARAHNREFALRMRTLDNRPLDRMLADSALANAKKARDLEPEDFFFCCDLARAYEAQGLYEPAVKMYLMARHLLRAMWPTGNTYYPEISYCLLKLGRSDEAIACSDSALALPSNRTLALSLRADLEMMRGKDSVAYGYYERAVRAGRGSRGSDLARDKDRKLTLLSNTALCAFRLRKYDDALKYVLQVLEVDPADAYARELYSLVKTARARSS